VSRSPAPGAPRPSSARSRRRRLAGPRQHAFKFMRPDLGEGAHSLPVSLTLRRGCAAAGSTGVNRGRAASAPVAAQTQAQRRGQSAGRRTLLNSESARRLILSKSVNPRVRRGTGGLPRLRLTHSARLRVGGASSACQSLTRLGGSPSQGRKAVRVMERTRCNSLRPSLRGPATEAAASAKQWPQSGSRRRWARTQTFVS
jgi:hypothetical protein